ncbi:hypothetical protein [Paracoccus rhizosphaerae]|uniref:Uncharacterized protein n=1 Tax=Paracoccus rhizosphaerae TaxID=1133347 RepID=A0ABV6CL90_9RHOB|nr:hypothetical protein [Paracoccus rhizosphaerae]
MLTDRKLDEVQAEISKIEQLMSALSIIVDDVDEAATGHRRRQLDALIGVTAAATSQVQKAQDAFETLFEALRATENAA